MPCNTRSASSIISLSERRAQSPEGPAEDPWTGPAASLAQWLPMSASPKTLALLSRNEALSEYSEWDVFWARGEVADAASRSLDTEARTTREPTLCSGLVTFGALTTFRTRESRSGDREVSPLCGGANGEDGSGATCATGSLRAWQAAAGAATDDAAVEGAAVEGATSDGGPSGAAVAGGAVVAAAAAGTGGGVAVRLLLLPPTAARPAAVPRAD
eukprot:CAMPEP_0179102338 /NCGR_PEP_ID=MMETSP0796-20121207/47361_1 /TAXON_ID=73915 /ORGANISM="Pyrodinium bahamense, Strain pbaha01" /LENGTH=214 /DNA_ID=CAMNT_0020800211 /DNA_START=916 /DNA_END=1560 /DNA_ORIENTATION=+